MRLDASVNYFYSLINKEGIIQFSRGFNKDWQFGYAIEDQARALIVALHLNDLRLVHLLSDLLLRAVSKNGVKMLWSNNGEFIAKEDYFGEASAEVVWAVGEYLAGLPSGSRIRLSLEELYRKLSERLLTTPYTRVTGYALLGASKVKDHTSAKLLADKLVFDFKHSAKPDWPWFEDQLFYANALLPWSLLTAYNLLENSEYLQTALVSLDFLLQETKINGVPVTIGNKGWWSQSSIKNIYDQQPIDVAYMTLCLLEAYRATHNPRFLGEASTYFSWFEGNNLQSQNMIRRDGGCCDGLNSQGVNPNSGAESNLCYLLTALQLQSFSAAAEN